MRKRFIEELIKAMRLNKNIWFLTGDLGYKVFDPIRDEFPDRFLNPGAAEQAMMGIAVGLALEGKIPFVYSITPFVLYRPFETIRNYVNHEHLNVKIVGNGIDRDYAHEGFSHWAEDESHLFGSRNIFKNIQACYPKYEEDIPIIMKTIISHNKPYYLNLKK